jgi:hypothetical protein
MLTMMMGTSRRCPPSISGPPAAASGAATSNSSSLLSLLFKEAEDMRAPSSSFRMNDSPMFPMQPPSSSQPVLTFYDWSDIPLQGDLPPAFTSARTRRPTDPSVPPPPPPPPLMVKTFQQDDDDDDDDCCYSTTATTATATTHRRRPRRRFLPTSPVSSMDWSNTTTTTTRVSFAEHGTVRTYGVIVGDHPACELPMQLGELQSEEQCCVLSLFHDNDDNYNYTRNTAIHNSNSRVGQRQQRRRQRPIPLCYEERLEVIQASTGLSEDVLRRQEYDILHLAAQHSPHHSPSTPSSPPHFS